MATQVRETAAGKSISAYVVLNKKGEHVATVNAHFSNGGRVSVDVWNLGDKAINACLDGAIRADLVTEKTLEKAIAASEAKRDWEAKGSDRHTDWAAFDLFGLQQGSAGGYGYDKFAAALRGLWVDGHQMADHCGQSDTSRRLLANYERACRKFETRTPKGQGVSLGYALPEGFQKTWDQKARKIGARFTNYNGGRYRSLYLETGLKRLETLGYRVIQAI